MLIDTHCHLQMAQYDADRDAVIGRMRERGMVGILIGTCLEDSRSGVALATQHDFLFSAVGVHPTETNVNFNVSAFRELSDNPKVVAIGETGLDYYRDTNRVRQRKLFEAQLAFARQVGKPVIVHCRDAYDDVSAMLKSERGLSFVIHTFSGDEKTAEQFLELGGMLGFSGIVTFDTTGIQGKVVAMTPIEKILIETDAPYLAPVPYRGKRNEPIYVEEVAKRIAVIKNLPPETVIKHTGKNAMDFFRIS